MNESNDLQAVRELLFRLCAAPGTPGDEQSAAKEAAEELARYGDTEIDRMGNVVARLGKPGAKTQIMLDAHLDQIGMIVTFIDDKGFLHVDRCGGVDRRVLPGAPVSVYGREALTGIVCCTPPHLSDGEEKVEPIDRLAIDVGLKKEAAERLVRPGDRILFHSEPKGLLGSRVTAAGLDDRAGVAALIRCVQLLADADLNCGLTVLCSSREEVGGQGAVTGTYSVDPTQAIAVDVDFAEQPDVPAEKCGKLGGGPMIGVAPALSRALSDRLIKLAQVRRMPYRLIVTGGPTETNGDEISVSRGGVPTALVSIPLRYMHTPVEVIDLEDVERTAQLIAAYIREVEA